MEHSILNRRGEIEMNKLADQLMKLDGKGYKALKSVTGTYTGAFYKLHIDYVQGDPFASPSRIRVYVPFSETDFKKNDFDRKHRKTAFEHFFAKVTSCNIRSLPNPVKGTGKSGVVFIDTPGQQMLDRTAVRISEMGIEFRLSIGLPARGRTILGKQAANLLKQFIPSVIEKTIRNYERKKLRRIISLSDEQNDIRKYIKENQLICFVGNGAVLPRISGVSDKPMQEKTVISFRTPAEYAVTIPLSTGREIAGMGVPEGITVITGGGYHGKSTLLQAIEKGVYNHEPEDGREYVITDDTAMKIRAEDGRSIQNVNISPFINQLPFNKDTVKFSSPDASGSTSQAANIIEAMEMRSGVLLIDEDTSATNFMIRDARMQKLIKKEKEPITPFIDRVRQLYTEKDVSTILVIGGSGDYFDAADHVIAMDEYLPYDRTEEAKEIAGQLKSGRVTESKDAIGSLMLRPAARRKIAASLDRKGKVDSKGLHTILIGKNKLSLNAVEQLTDESQTRAIALMIKKIITESGPKEMIRSIDQLYREIEEKGLEAVSPFKGQHPGDLALPRKNEVAAAFNRIRV